MLAVNKSKFRSIKDSGKEFHSCTVLEKKLIQHQSVATTWILEPDSQYQTSTALVAEEIV